MFRKLFGETEQEQIHFLQSRASITIVILTMFLVAIILKSVGISGGAATITNVAEKGVAIIMLFMWGWPIVKSLFGITALGVLFSRNVVIGVVLFIVYLLLAYFLGIVLAFIGTIRYIYLRIKYGKNVGGLKIYAEI